MNMKQARNLLLSIFMFAMLFALAIVVLYETDTLEPGVFAAESHTEFLCTTFMELLTLGGIFLALRLFKFDGIHQQLVNQKAKGLSKWGTIRLILLMTPLVTNTYFYYLFMNTTFGYMAIIGLLCTPFVFPSMARCEDEVADNQ